MKQNFSRDSSTLDTEFGFNSSKFIWPYGLKYKDTGITGKLNVKVRSMA